jgi:hypothetical protein
MSCADMRVLLQAMLDHELDLADAARVEATCRCAPTVRPSTGGKRRLGPQFADQSRDTARRTTFVRGSSPQSGKQRCRAGLRGGGERSPVGGARACHWPWQ